MTYVPSVYGSCLFLVLPLKSGEFADVPQCYKASVKY